MIFFQISTNPGFLGFLRGFGFGGVRNLGISGLARSILGFGIFGILAGFWIFWISGSGIFGILDFPHPTPRPGQARPDHPRHTPASTLPPPSFHPHPPRTTTPFFNYYSFKAPLVGLLLVNLLMQAWHQVGTPQPARQGERFSRDHSRLVALPASQPAPIRDGRHEEARCARHRLSSERVIVVDNEYRG